MIFVTVGTHEQSFNRLIQCIDELKRDGKIKEEVIMQTGFCTYEPHHCNWSKMYRYNDMVRNVENARIVITHGGPSSFIMALQAGKVPVVVPRIHELDEHVNNHQVQFVKNIKKMNSNIIAVYDINQLGSVIKDYDEIVASMPREIISNNKKFNEELEKLVEECFVGGIKK